MNDVELKDFETWFRAQPDYCSYTRVRSFLSGLLSCSKAKAEVEMAKLQEKGEIKIISKKSGNSGRRVFLTPLTELTEPTIRSVWSSEMATKDINKIAIAVHDKTGHDVPNIKEFMRSLDTSKVNGKTFQWRSSEPNDDEEFIK